MKTIVEIEGKFVVTPEQLSAMHKLFTEAASVDNPSYSSKGPYERTDEVTFKVIMVPDSAVVENKASKAYPPLPVLTPITTQLVEAPKPE